MQHKIGPHLGHIRCIAASSDCRLLAFGCGSDGLNDAQIHLLDLPEAETRASIEIDSIPESFTFIADDLLVAGLRSGELLIFNPHVSPDSAIFRIRASTKPVRALATDLTGTTLAAAGDDGILRVLRLSFSDGTSTLELVAEHRLGKPLRAVAVDALAANVATADVAGTISIFALGTSESSPTTYASGTKPTTLVFVGDDGLLLVGDEQGTVSVLGHAESGLRAKTLSADGDHSGAIRNIIVSSLPSTRPDPGKHVPGRRILSVGGDGLIKSWPWAGHPRPPVALRVGDSPLGQATWLSNVDDRDALGGIAVSNDQRRIFVLNLDHTLQLADPHLCIEPQWTELEQHLRHEDTERRLTVIDRLVELRDDRARQLLERTMANDPNAAVRRRSAQAIGKRGTAASHATLRAALDDPDARVRDEAFSAILALESQKTSDPLADALNSPHQEVRIAATLRLGSAGGHQGQQLAEKQLQDPSNEVWAAAVWSLGKIELRRGGGRRGGSRTVRGVGAVAGTAAAASLLVGAAALAAGDSAADSRGGGTGGAHASASTATKRTAGAGSPSETDTLSAQGPADGMGAEDPFPPPTAGAEALDTEAIPDSAYIVDDEQSIPDDAFELEDQLREAEDKVDALEDDLGDIEDAFDDGTDLADQASDAAENASTEGVENASRNAQDAVQGAQEGVEGAQEGMQGAENVQNAAQAGADGLGGSTAESASSAAGLGGGVGDAIKGIAPVAGAAAVAVGIGALAASQSGNPTDSTTSDGPGGGTTPGADEIQTTSVGSDTTGRGSEGHGIGGADSGGAGSDGGGGPDSNAPAGDDGEGRPDSDAPAGDDGEGRPDSDAPAGDGGSGNTSNVGGDLGAAGDLDLPDDLPDIDQLEAAGKLRDEPESPDWMMGVLTAVGSTAAGMLAVALFKRYFGGSSGQASGAQSIQILSSSTTAIEWTERSTVGGTLSGSNSSAGGDEGATTGWATEDAGKSMAGGARTRRLLEQSSEEEHAAYSENDPGLLPLRWSAYWSQLLGGEPISTLSDEELQAELADADAKLPLHQCGLDQEADETNEESDGNAS